MKNRNISSIFVIAIIFLVLLVSGASAQIAEESFHIPGTVEGVGRHFEITDSEYLNVTLESSENVSIRIESAPEMIVLDIKASESASRADFVLSGFPANATFHKYQDGYEDYMPLFINEGGITSFDQNISQSHIIFIQPRKSTKIIKDDPTGGHCASIGSWDRSSGTCTLNQDVNETIQISSDNITLNGNGHNITGAGTGSGIYFQSRKGITIKNIAITGFFYGINLSYSSGNKINTVTLKNNRNGVNLNYSNKNIISINSITQSADSGLKLFYSTGNIFSDNIISSSINYGIYQSWQNYYKVPTSNIYENNNVSDNVKTGIYIYGGSGDAIIGNSINNNLSDGMLIVQSNFEILSGNTMSGNKPHNFSLSGGDMSSNNIDTSNAVEGKAIYYITNAIGESFDGIDAGIFYCAKCENITLKNVSLSVGNAQIYFWQSNSSLVENVSSPDKNIEITLYNSNNNVIRKNTFGGIYINYSNDNQVYNNNIMNIDGTVAQTTGSERNLFSLDLPVGGNYWKKYASNCKDNNNDGFCDSPRTIYSKGIDNYPLAKEFSSEPPCCSSVMFLPGHQASRLYRDDFGNEDRLWEPNNHNEDVEQLYLDSSGKSADPDIYTRDIIDETYGGVNIYENFISFMGKMVSDGIINGWQYIPYDWRLPLEDIVNDGVKLEDGEVGNIIQEVRDLAAQSKTGKVTLIGHSNGGLLGKTIINKLKETNEEKLVDRLVMIATPQLGTPKAIAGLLHGDEIDLLSGFLLDKKTGRGFAENMSSAYNLLPSREYFNDIQSPVVEFDSDVDEIYDFPTLYGEKIDNWDEFKKFLLGDNGGRFKPEFEDTDSPNVLKESLLLRSEETHNSLDSWQAPEGMEVIQIAGWGLDTIRGIKYDDCDFIFCPDNLSNLDRSLILTEDGDETVVVPSAVEMGGNAERYYINLNRYNRLLNPKVSREHADILEIEPLRDFIKNIIQKNRTLTDYMYTEKPVVEDEDDRLRFRLHSPVSLNIYDQDGNHTGLIYNSDSDLQLVEKQIPNSYYLEFGETKYAGAGDYPVDIKLIGEDLGTFTFEIDQVTGDQVAKNTTFANIPVMKGMKAVISVSDSVGEMKIDINNDGQVDMAFDPGEEIGRDDMLEILQKIVYYLNIDPTVKDRLINKIDNAGKQMAIGHIISANAMLENVKQQIETFSRENTPEKFMISNYDAEKLVEIINKIQVI